MKLWLYALLCLLSAAGSAHAANLGGIHTIKEVEFVTGNNTQPPALATVQWQKIELPDMWQSNHPDYGGSIWYHLPLTMNALPTCLWAIYLPRINMNAAVFVNGEMVGNGGSFSQPMARNWNRPLFFTVPKSLWQRGINHILIRVQADKHCRGNLFPVQAGSEERLRPIYEHALLLQVDILKVLFVLSLCISLITSVLWLLHRRNNAMYGWYALGTFFWAIYSQYFFVQNISVSTHVWMWLTFSSGYGMIISMMLFCQCFMAMECNWCKRVIPACGLLASALLYLTPLDSMFEMIDFSFMVLVLFVLFMFTHLLRYIVLHRSIETALLGLGVLVNVVFGIHDILTLRLGWTPPVYLLHYGMPVMLLAMGVILINRFISVLKESERLNLELDGRVKQREDELLAAHRKLRVVERKEAILQERERMVEDLHDGMGGQLAAALTLVDKPDGGALLKQALEDAMLDFRLVIDSMDDENHDIATLLGMLRMRLEPQLQAAGIKLRWHYDGVRDASEMRTVDPEVSLHILRIVQEAISNAIRHANADVIEVAILVDGGVLNIRVRDNGVGMDEGRNHGGGHGIGHMYKRAARVGVQLDINSSSQGVEVCLTYRPNPA